jgi:hypothetical protein
MKKLARTVLAYHNNQEKRELQRREKQERERLRALKANDEEAYPTIFGNFQLCTQVIVD